MGFKICMNISCRKTCTHEWKKGWLLQSGEYAQLCYTCGSAYENSVYCDTFHEQQSGWRDCLTCNKSVHCGCLASKYLFEHLDLGGIVCNNCMKSSQPQLIQNSEIFNGFGSLVKNNGSYLDSTLLENHVCGISVNEEKLAQLCRLMEAHESNLMSKLDGAESNAVHGQFRKEEVKHPIEEAITGFSNPTQIPAGISKFVKPDSTRSVLDMRDMNGQLAQSSLSMTSPFQQGQGQRSRPIFPKPSKPSYVSETNKAEVSELRIARPPAEGRGKNQLLPRYWPRITDQELQQISGDLNSKIVPLFEKVLSASDAGRIGRLVLPKACAEAYFPPISQSEGLPLRVQDIKGREWTFQFRYWPNNNSRMYVLEGVTPCIQSMQLQAGDTITFSRIDPGGKLVMGFRKSTNNSTEDSQTSSALPNGPTVAETSYSGDGGNLWNKRSMVNGAITPEKKRARNIGPKSKRLLMHSDEALELQYTWEEAQDLLRPPPTVKPNIVSIEDYDIEEYDEPPVFGKRTIFADRSSGGQEQWAQCDNCSKWRKLPEDAFLPPKWTCSDNVWDSSRCWCSAPEEMGAKDLDNLSKVNRDFKKRRQKTSPEWEASGLDALASAAVLGDTLGEPSTTKHPRHRPGCTCIVCIQPPSGKGKHEPTCTCNVCMTVKRRFKTLMLRKKKRQSEREAENSRPETTVLHVEDDSENHNKEVAENSAGQIDLNCDPNSSHLDNIMMNIVDPNGFTNLTIERRLQSQTNGDDMRRMSDEAFLASIGWNFKNRDE